MQKILLAFVIGSILLLGNSCQNPYGTDPNTKIVKMDEKNDGSKDSLYTFDNSKIHIAVTEYITTTEHYHDWNEYFVENFIRELVDYKIDSIANPMTLNVEVTLKHLYTQSDVTNRKYIVESIHFKLHKVPRVKSIEIPGNTIFGSECEVEIRELLTGNLINHKVNPADFFVIYPMIYPVIYFDVFIRINTDFTDEISHLTFQSYIQ